MDFSRGKIITLTGILLMSTFAPVQADAFLFHATEKSAARRILSKGLNSAKFRARARFGKGAYFAKKTTTAAAEKGEASSIIRFREKTLLKKKTIDLRNPGKEKLHSLLGNRYDLRGAIKKKVIGPKAGRRLGRIAGNDRKVITYRSVKNGGSNVVIPKKTLQQNPKIIRAERIVK